MVYEQLKHVYVISTGGQSEQSNGIYVRQNVQNYNGAEHEVGVAIGARLWKAAFYLPVNSWTHLALTFSQSTGLKLMVDCQLAASDMAGSERFYIETVFQQFADIVVGQSNDVPLDTTTSPVAVGNVTHADVVYTKTECDALIGRPPIIIISSSSSSSISVIYSVRTQFTDSYC